MEVSDDELDRKTANGDLKKFKKNLPEDIPADNINAKDENGSTALHRAVSNKDTEMVKLLLGYGADSNIKNNYGTTPLHMAILSNSPEIAKLLLAYGADINAKSKGGKSPLDLAQQLGRLDIITLLKNE